MHFFQRIAAVLLFLLCCGNAIAQLVYFFKPQQLGFYPRNLQTNQAEIKIAGKIGGSYNQVRYKVSQDGKSLTDVRFNLNYSGGVAPFEFKYKIKAGKFHYLVEWYFYGSDTIHEYANHLVAGDAFIIQGQSNAVANAYWGYANPQYKDSFIRSFGTSNYNYSNFIADSFWHIADGDGYYGAGCIGQWGLVLAKSLLDSFGIPIAILNGAVGGTSVYSHQRYNPQPDHWATIYGRLLYRAKLAGLNNHIRSILYFQGESDGAYPRFHDSLFKQLYADWALDYKGMQKNYLVQVRSGCGNPTPAFCEVQRQFEFSLPKLQVISSNGLNGHDGCHYYFKDGYGLLGLQLFALVKRDLYGSPVKKDIDPPQIAHAWFNNATKTEIKLAFKNVSDSIWVDPNFHQLFSVSGDSGVTVISGKCIKNTVFLTLNKSTCKPLFLTYFGLAGSRPWIKNRTKAGLIGFHLLPIENPIPKTTYAGCKNDWITIGENSLAGYKYEWVSLKNGSKKFISKWQLHLLEDEKFNLYLTHGCKKDTFEVWAIVDKGPNKALGSDTILCNGQAITSQLNWVFPQIKWSQNGIDSFGQSFTTNQSGKLKLWMKSTLGCIYQDSMHIFTSSPQHGISFPTHLCKDDSFKIQAPHPWHYVFDDKEIKNNTWYLKPGKHILKFTDTWGCSGSEILQTNAYLPPEAEIPTLTACEGEKVTWARPQAWRQWIWNEQLHQDTIQALSGIPYQIKTIDTFGCANDFVWRATAKPLPRFSLGNDTAVCDGNEVIFKCPLSSTKYVWNGEISYSSQWKSNRSGPIICTVEGSNLCKYSDTAYLKVAPLPQEVFPIDTQICIQKPWKLIPSTNHFVWYQGKKLDSLVISNAGIYAFTIVTSNGCMKDYRINVVLKNCFNFIVQNEKNELKIFPNPVKDKLNFITHSAEKNIAIYAANGKLIYDGQIDENGLDVSNMVSGTYFLLWNSQYFWFVKE